MGESEADQEKKSLNQPEKGSKMMNPSKTGSGTSLSKMPDDETESREASVSPTSRTGSACVGLMFGG